MAVFVLGEVLAGAGEGVAFSVEAEGLVDVARALGVSALATWGNDRCIASWFAVC